MIPPKNLPGGGMRGEGSALVGTITNVVLDLNRVRARLRRYSRDVLRSLASLLLDQLQSATQRADAAEKRAGWRQPTQQASHWRCPECGTLFQGSEGNPP